MTTSSEELEQEAHEKELCWLLEEIHLALNLSVIVGIQECIGRLCDKANGVKLVMSSSRRETVKGTVDRVGLNISDCDILVKLPSANRGHPFPIRLAKPDTDADKPGAGTTATSYFYYPLSQVVDTANFLNEALQVSEQLVATCYTSPVDKYSTPCQTKHDDVQTRLALSETLGFVKSALTSLHEPKSSSIYPEHTTDRAKFIDLPPGVAVDFYLQDSNIITDIRTFEDIGTNHNAALGSITTMLSLGKKKMHPTVVQYNGTSIIEHERIRVESQDPNLISVTSKLTALEGHLEAMVRKLQLCLSG